MYIVVSRWDAVPGKWDAFEAAGRKMRSVIRAWPEVESMSGLRIGPNSILAIIGYKSEADYERLIKDPSGPFEKAARENGLEDLAVWAWSERGEELED